MTHRYRGGERLLPIQALAFVSAWWLEHITVHDRVFVALAREAVE